MNNPETSKFFNKEVINRFTGFGGVRIESDLVFHLLSLINDKLVCSLSFLSSHCVAKVEIHVFLCHVIFSLKCIFSTTHTLWLKSALLFCKWAFLLIYYFLFDVLSLLLPLVATIWQSVPEKYRRLKQWWQGHHGRSRRHLLLLKMDWKAKPDFKHL